MPRLTEVADLIMGQSPPSTTYNKVGDGLPFFQGKTDFGALNPKVRLYCSSPTKIAVPGDILISVRAPVGPTNIADQVCCIGRGLAAIRPCRIDGNFLYFNLRYIEQFVASLGSGSTFHAINKALLSEVCVNENEFRPDEQRKIAAVLSLVQRAIEQQEHLIALTTELKQSLMHKLFTEGLYGEPQKQTEIGPIPESWHVFTVGEVATLRSGGTPSRKETAYWEHGDIPWVKTGEINYRDIYGTEEHITTLGLKNSSANLFPPGTLLMAMYGQGVTRGRVARLAVPAATNQACVAFFPDDTVDSQFLYYLFQNDYEKLRGMGHGANQANLSAEILRSVRVPVPTCKSEQREIAEALTAVDKAIDLGSTKKQLLTELFRTLLHQLMTAQIRIDDMDQAAIHKE